MLVHGLIAIAPGLPLTETVVITAPVEPLIKLIEFPELLVTYTRFKFGFTVTPYGPPPMAINVVSPD